MKIKLEELSTKIINPTIKGNEVEVSLDWERLKEDRINVIFDARVGNSNETRTVIQAEYGIYLNDKELDIVAEDILQDIVEAIVPRFSSIVSSLDNNIQNIPELEIELDEKEYNDFSVS